MRTPDDARPRLTPEGKFALCLIAGEICLFVPFIILGQPELGLGSCTCLGMVAIAAWLNWASRERRWFWLAVVLSAAIQIPLVLYYPRGTRVYRPLLMPLGICDVAVAWGMIKLFSRLSPTKGNQPYE